ncbi:hypothetical protein KP77_34610 [Jeotgalibacillus alimentarius]|uniref:Tetratricopeptide repeat protein n=1 Tax=Jeotgalibacillus alimentarius TaxID=135826 RepID=A0A0C2VE46_9BACL|nr:tetratricopeptide repeat protein [Jeotgalibacillus alimentarius]KIL42831.1 hypothetical protein KP77_34610 [Jeotgalibacillus alimentarius]
MNIIFNQQLLDTIWTDMDREPTELYKVKLAALTWMKENSTSVEDPNTRIVIEFLLEYALEMKQLGERSKGIAEGTFKQILKVDPKNPLARYRLAYIYYTRKDWQIASLFFQQAYKNNVPAMYFNLKDDQMIKAQLYSAECHVYLAKQAFQTALEDNDVLFQLETDIGRPVEPFLRSIQAQLESREYVLYKSSERRMTSKTDAEDIFDDLGVNDLILFDNARNWILSNGRSEVVLQSETADFLKELILKHYEDKPLSYDHVRHQYSEDNIRQKKRRLKQYAKERLFIVDLFTPSENRTMRLNPDYNYILAYPTDDTFVS